MGGAGARVSARQWSGLLLGFAGLVLVVWRKLTQGAPGDHVTAANLSWAVLALLSITAGTLYQKRFVRPCDVRTANTVQLLAAALVTAPLAWLEPESVQWQRPRSSAPWPGRCWRLTLGGSSLLYLLIQRGAAASVDQPDVSGAALHGGDGLAAVRRADHRHHAGRHCHDGLRRQPGGAAAAARARLTSAPVGGRCVRCGTSTGEKSRRGRCSGAPTGLIPP
jgi:hypothetical protein